MTYCLGLMVEEGLVCLSDGRITSGTQVRNARKASLHGPEGREILIMTSGLRSLRDKTLAYFDRLQEEQDAGFASLLDAVGVYGDCLRQVGEEDREALERSDLTFNLHALIAGQLPGDSAPGILLVYPEGNWIAVDRRTPYLSIGATTYGKPILDRALRYETSLKTALKLAYLSFDSTRFSSADVGYPIDMLTFSAGEGRWREALFDYDDLRDQRGWWNEHLTHLVSEMPDGPWTEALMPQEAEQSGTTTRLSLVQED